MVAPLAVLLSTPSRLQALTSLLAAGPFSFVRVCVCGWGGGLVGGFPAFQPSSLPALLLLVLICQIGLNTHTRLARPRPGRAADVSSGVDHYFCRILTRSNTRLRNGAALAGASAPTGSYAGAGSDGDATRPTRPAAS